MAAGVPSRTPQPDESDFVRVALEVDQPQYRATVLNTIVEQAERGRLVVKCLVSKLHAEGMHNLAVAGGIHPRRRRLLHACMTRNSEADVTSGCASPPLSRGLLAANGVFELDVMEGSEHL